LGAPDAISVSVVHPLMRENGWTFDKTFEGATGDTLFGFDFMHQIYTSADAAYSGRVTVPVLWDKEQHTIVSNESSEIIRMFNSAFDASGAATGDFYPERLRAEINEINALVYENINNGVYRAGFATTQTAYEAAFESLFSALDTLETRLSAQPFLVGNAQTEADWRLFTTLVRFDAVYVGHFKCNKMRIADYPALSAYQRRLYDVSGIAETISIPHIKHHYYASHESINPTGIVPAGPELDWAK
jgi:glutathionyl-hydroquinone reductase